MIRRKARQHLVKTIAREVLAEMREGNTKADSDTVRAAYKQAVGVQRGVNAMTRRLRSRFSGLDTNLMDDAKEAAGVLTGSLHQLYRSLMRKEGSRGG